MTCGWMGDGRDGFGGGLTRQEYQRMGSLDVDCLVLLFWWKGSVC